MQRPAPASTQSSYNKTLSPILSKTDLRGSSTAGRRWQSDWKDYPSLLLSAILLLGWIVAALQLATTKRILPLNYFQGRFGDLLNHGNYNIVISIAGSVIGAIVAWGLSQGFKHLLRTAMLRNKGVGLRQYEVLNKLASNGILYRFQSGALAALALFVATNQFSAATQAAFGTSLAKYNLSVPAPLFRLGDNPSYMYKNIIVHDIVNLPQFAGTYTFGITACDLFAETSILAGDFDNIVENAMTSVQDPDAFGGYTSIVIDQQSQNVQQGGPVINLDLAATISSANSSILYGLNMSSATLGLIGDNSGSNTVYLDTEGYSSDVTCSVVNPPWSARESADGVIVDMQISLPDCDGPYVTRIYFTDQYRALDSYACKDYSPVLYFFLVALNPANLQTAWRCEVNTSVALYDTAFFQSQDTDQVISVPFDAMSTNFTGNLVEASGRWFWDQFGPFGNPKLEMAYQMYEESSPETLDQAFVQLLELSVGLVTSAVAAKTGGFAVLEALASNYSLTEHINATWHNALVEVSRLLAFLQSATSG